MAFKVAVLLSVLAAAHAGYIADHGAILAAPAPAITSGHMNILRSHGNLGQVSTYSKTIDTPFSSVSKHDVRISNPGLAVHSAPVAYAAPAYASHGYAAPAIAAPAYASHGYAAPAYASHGYAAPAIAKIAAPVAYAAPAYASHGYAAPAYAAPAYASHGYAAPIAKVAAAPALIGVAYSAAPAVSHMSYSNGVGLSYAW